MKQLLILSGKGGTGKTTTAAAFIHFSQTRAMADCDVDAPNLHLVAAPPVSPEISEFLEGRRLWLILINVLAAGSVRPTAGLMLLKRKREDIG